MFITKSDASTMLVSNPRVPRHRRSHDNYRSHYEDVRHEVRYPPRTKQWKGPSLRKPWGTHGYNKFERAIEALSYAVIGNENTEEKFDIICERAARKIMEISYYTEVFVFNRGYWHGNSYAKFTLHGTDFIVAI